jgi:glutathione S-transferase
MILYGYGLSSATFRVRIALALKNIPYTSVIKNLRVGEHRLAEFLNINAQGFVPALQADDGSLLTQSVAIMEYLDEQYPDPPLLPRDAGRAGTRPRAQPHDHQRRASSEQPARAALSRGQADPGQGDPRRLVSALDRSRLRSAGALVEPGIRPPGDFVTATR